VRRALGPALLVALTLAACSGGGSNSGDTKTASPGNDKAATVRINLRATDFPEGWTSAPHQGTPDEGATTTQYQQCVGIPDPATRFTADTRSLDFSKGQGTSASSQVRMAKTADDASADLAAFQSAKGPECFKQTIEKLLPGRLPPGTTVGNLSTRQLEFPPLKDGTAAFRAEFTIAVGGQVTLPVYADSIVFQSGRAEVVLNTTSTGAPFDSKLEEDLAKKMAERT